MNLNPSVKKGDPNKDLSSSTGIQDNTNPYQHEINVTEGSEFLDDAIRTKDQLFGETILKENMNAFTIDFNE